VKAVLLAAGYATRLRPLTDRLPKQLLPVGGRPILDWILDKVRELEEVDQVHLVTNSHYVEQFEAWAGPHGVAVHDDGTRTNEDRLGAVGDLRLTIERAGIDDDLLVLAGDNLFEFGLAGLVAFARSRGTASALAVYDCGDLELAREMGIVELDGTGRVVHFVEKPKEPPSTLASTATYVFPREHVPLVERYLGQGNPPDNIGSFLGWLSGERPVYGYRFEGRWYDIGNRAQLLEADTRLREQAGLPVRADYPID
jgi:glucose-1-phosphate thymidylyltransferase